MAKKKKEIPGPPPPAPWMNTFADLMNLLVCFFVMIVAMSSVKEDEFEQMAASMSNAFGFSILQGGAISIGEGTMISNGVAQLNNLSEYYNSLGLSNDGEKNKEAMKQQYEQEAMQQSEALAEAVEKAIIEKNLNSDVDIDFNSQYVSLQMNGTLLFDSGQATIKSEAQEYLQKIGDVLQQYEGHMIEIIGHTDNVPIVGGKYADNMELSCNRAMSVARYLQQNKGLDPVYLQYSGRGEYAPVATNDTPEGRARNRRVEIRIYWEVNSN